MGILALQGDPERGRSDCGWSQGGSEVTRLQAGAGSRWAGSSEQLREQAFNIRIQPETLNQVGVAFGNK